MPHKLLENNANVTNQLEAELASLRKGNGLTALKLGQTEQLLYRLARMQQQPPETFSPQQAYHAILGKISELPDGVTSLAIRVAYGLDEHSPSLIARRDSLAARLDKHPATIVRHENLAIRQLADSIAHGHPQAPPDQPEKTSQEDVIEHQRGALRQSAVSSLSGLLDLWSYGDDLVTALQINAPACIDCDIRIRLTPSALGAGWYRYDLNYRFSGRHQQFTLAIVSQLEDGDRLVAAGLVTEYAIISQRDNPNRSARSLINAARLIARRGDSKRQHDLPFRMLDESKTKHIFASLSHPLLGPCWILRAEIPPQWRGENIRYEYHIHFDVSSKLQTAFWYAPNLMYVRSLRWEFQDWADELPPNTIFQCCSFMGSPGGTTITANNNRLTTYPNGWLLRGHGLELHWITTSS